MLNFRQLDLNLLVTLDALLAEHNVTRAAERLHLAQPTVSVQLARLREALGDPLLIPGSRGMTPTARADALREPLRQALATLQAALTPGATFDPGAASNTWRIAASDYSEATVLLPALASLHTAAPGVRLAIVQKIPSQLGRLAEQGEIDLALHTVAGSPPGLRQRVLFAERYVLAAREGHPTLRRKPTLTQFTKLSHVIISPDGGGFTGPTDDALAAAGLRRHVALSVPHFQFAAKVVAESDLVAMLPERLTRGLHGIRTFEAPVQVLGFEMSMLWHERVHHDPAHRWLREQVARAVGSGSVA